MKRAGKTTIRLTRLALLVVLVTTAVAACGGSSTPPGASKAMGSCGPGRLPLSALARGAGGDDLARPHRRGHGHSAGFVAGRFYIERGSARSADGRSLAWEVQTQGRHAGEVHIGGVRYGLAAGNAVPRHHPGGHDGGQAALSRPVGRSPGSRRDPRLCQERPGPGGVPERDPAGHSADRHAYRDTDCYATPLLPPAVGDAASTCAHCHATSAHPAHPPPSPAVERILFAPGATQADDRGLPAGRRSRPLCHGRGGRPVCRDERRRRHHGPGPALFHRRRRRVVVKPMGEAHVRTVVPSTQDYYVELVSDVGADRLPAERAHPRPHPLCARRHLGDGQRAAWRRARCATTFSAPWPASG